MKKLIINPWKLSILLVGIVVLAQTNIDNQGNITVNSISTGINCAGCAGVLQLLAGTAQSNQSPNSFRLSAPVSISQSYQWTVPTAQGTGYLYSTSGILSYQAGTSGGGGTSSSIGPGAFAYNSATQTFGVGSGTFTFNTNVWDTGGFHSTTTNPTQFVAASAGFYLARASVVATTNNVSFNIYFIVNGIPVIGTAASQGTASNNMNTAAEHSAILQLNTGDVVEAGTFTGTGFTTTANNSGFQIVKLATSF